MIKLELVDGKYKLSKKTKNTWNFMMLSEAELKHILKLIEEIYQPEALSQEWINEHSVAVAYDGVPDQTEIVYVDDLEKLLN